MNPMMTELLAYERSRERDREMQEIQRRRLILPPNAKNNLLRRMVHIVGVQMVRLGTKMQLPGPTEPVSAPVYNCD